jgi:LPXTG-motif cell wall-anchored protein
MSTATMLLLLGGSALAVGGLIYFAKKNKSPKSK